MYNPAEEKIIGGFGRIADCATEQQIKSIRPDLSMLPGVPFPAANVGDCLSFGEMPSMELEGTDVATKCTALRLRSSKRAQQPEKEQCDHEYYGGRRVRQRLLGLLFDGAGQRLDPQLPRSIPDVDSLNGRIWRGCVCIKLAISGGAHAVEQQPVARLAARGHRLHIGHVIDCNA